ncbi:MAG TPA: IS982 family transposase [Anaerolineales bacterium]|nr:IS982 family transposase [Anaerolineales bacterium]
MDSLLELFVNVDDFCQVFLPFWEQKLMQDGSKKRRRAGQLSVSEIMTIIIHFHQSRYRDFKTYYTDHVCQHLRAEFPNLVSYERFVILMPSVLGPLCAYLKRVYGGCRGISFIDSSALMVCDNHRIHNHKVFAGVAQRGKGSMGWFYGFKLHLVVNYCGELLACQITSGNVDDREPVLALSKRLFGKLIADRGYISQALFEQLLDTFGVQLITKLRKNMKNRLLPLMDKLLLRKRAIIESIVDQFKNFSQIEHTRHRSPMNCFVNIIAGLIAYCHQPKKPSLNLFPTGLLSA